MIKVDFFDKIRDCCCINICKYIIGKSGSQVC